MNPGSDQPTGRPWPCVLSAAVMLGVPAVWTLASPITASSGSSISASSAAAFGFVVILVLVVGASSAAYAIASPGQSAVATLAVLCAALALVFAPVEAWADGLSGIAALAFLLSLRLHAATRSGPVEVEEWIAARRPMLVGASVTTPAAIAAALVPTVWSLPVAALVGLVAAGLCTAVLAT